MRLTCESLEARENPAAFTPVVPQELWQQLAADVRVLAAGTVRPSQESVQNLVTVVQTSAADGQLTAREQAQITLAVNAVLASANVPVTEVTAVVADVQAITAAILGRV